MRFASFLTCLALLAGAGAAAATEPLPSTAAGESAIPIEYLSTDIPGLGRRKAALLVRVRIDGRECRMQLDTGANAAIIWDNGSPLAPETLTTAVTVQAGPLQQRTPVSNDLQMRLANCTEGESVGTLGNAFFDHGSLRLDLKAPALFYTPGSTLAADPRAQPMRYARWTAAGGHPLVEVRSEQAGAGHALLDTGSVPVELAVLSRDGWNAATHFAPLAPSQRVRQLTAQSWGRQRACYLAESDVHRSIGQQPHRTLAVLYCPDQLNFHSPEPLVGVLGMAAFGDGSLTLDYVAQRWLPPQ